MNNTYITIKIFLKYYVLAIQLSNPNAVKSKIWNVAYSCICTVYEISDIKRSTRIKFFGLIHIQLGISQIINAVTMKPLHLTNTDFDFVSFKVTT